MLIAHNNTLKYQPTHINKEHEKRQDQKYTRNSNNKKKYIKHLTQYTHIEKHKLKL